MKIEINHFKAFLNSFTLSINKKENVAIYGENGAGKSSLYEAFQWVFFRERFVNSKLSANRKITASTTPEDRASALSDIRGNLKNQKSANAFIIKIDDQNADDIERPSYKVFMMCDKDVYAQDEIFVNKLIENSYGDFDKTKLLTDEFLRDLQKEVNNDIHDFFFEEINVEIDFVHNNGYQYFTRCKIVDNNRRLERSENLTNYFNEAKIRMVNIVLMFNLIHRSINANGKNLIVFDDFINSLDASYRTFVVRYILKYFNKECSQLILMSHNKEFFNLLDAAVVPVNERPIKWIFKKLIYCDNNVELKKDFEVSQNVAELKKEWEKDKNADAIGNKIRQFLETLVMRLDKIYSLSGGERSRMLLDRIVTSDSIYWRNGKCDEVVLIKAIKDISESNAGDKIGKIKDKIKEYTKNDWNFIRNILLDLRLYQKIALHPLSHAHEAIGKPEDKEIEQSLILLEKLEKVLSTSRIK